MPVMIDQESLQIEQMGLQTVGQVLAHVQKDKRLVTSLLIDGEAPDLDRIGLVRQSPLLGHTVYIETVEPRQMALEVLGEVEIQLDEADRLRGSAVEMLYQNQPNRAMEKLSGCFSIWQIAQESVLKVAQLLRLDLESVCSSDQSIVALFQEFAAQLRQIKTALEDRDFVTLNDILTYEVPQTSTRWRETFAAIRQIIDGRKE